MVSFAMLLGVHTFHHAARATWVASVAALHPCLTLMASYPWNCLLQKNPSLKDLRIASVIYRRIHRCQPRCRCPTRAVQGCLAAAPCWSSNPRCLPQSSSFLNMKSLREAFQKKKVLRLHKLGFTADCTHAFEIRPQPPSRCLVV